MIQHKCTRNVRGYLLGSKSKSTEKRPVRDNCTGASRLFSTCQEAGDRYRTVTDKWVWHPQFGVANDRVWFGQNSNLYSFHPPLCSSVLASKSFRECFFCFLFYDLKKKKKVHDKFQYWTMNSCVADIHCREWSLSGDYPLAFCTVTPLPLYVYLVHYFGFD